MPRREPLTTDTPNTDPPKKGFKYEYHGEDIMPFTDIVKNIRENDQNSSKYANGLLHLGRLIKILSPSLRKIFGYAEADDKINELLLTTITQIRSGKLARPGALPAYIYGIARNMIFTKINTNERRSRLNGSLREWTKANVQDENPEEISARAEKLRIALEFMGKHLTQRDYEILERFYLREQPYQQICEEMSLTETQFRLFKSRALQKLRKFSKAASTDRGTSASKPNGSWK